MRTFLGWPGDGSVRVQPFLRAKSDPNKWDVYKFNPEWVRMLQRFQRMMAKCGMGIMMDFFGLQVAQMEKIAWAWFISKNNVNDIGGYADLRPHVMQYWKWCLCQVMSIIGVEGNPVHLGNEQNAPGDAGYGQTNVKKIRAGALTGRCLSRIT